MNYYNKHKGIAKIFAILFLCENNIAIAKIICCLVKGFLLLYILYDINFLLFFCYAERLHSHHIPLQQQTKGSMVEWSKTAHC